MAQIPTTALKDVQLIAGSSLGLVVSLRRLPKHASPDDMRQAARRVLRSLLARLMSTSPESLRFGRSSEGKPFLVGAGAPSFNLSHSRGYSLIALSLSSEVGCDIEDRFTDEDVAALCPLVLHPAELEAMDRLAAQDRQAAFRRYWVRKEAVLKAAGSGFLVDPRHLITGLEYRHARWTALASPPFTIHNQLVEPGCVAAVVSMDPACTWRLLNT